MTASGPKGQTLSTVLTTYLPCSVPKLAASSKATTLRQLAVIEN